MSTTITSTTAPRTTPSPTSRRVVTRASLVAVTADLVLMGIIGAIIPPLALLAALTVVLVVAARRWPHVGVVGLSLLALVANGGGLEFLVSDLANPTDPIAFLWAILSGGGRVVVIVATILAFTAGDLAARRLATVSLVVLGLAVLGSLTARLAVTSDASQPDDVEVVTEGVTFPDRVVVPSGGVVLVDNRDPVRHTFTVEDSDVDVLLEPGVQRRIPIALDPGTYDLVCIVPGHESMTSTLEVS